MKRPRLREEDAWRPRAPLAAPGRLVFALCLLATACAPEPAAPGLLELDGRLVADPGVYVVPDRAWRREGVVGGSFRRAGTLLVQVEDVEVDRLIFEFFPDGDTGSFHFTATWDGSPVWESPRAGIDQKILVEIDRSVLDRGLHRLVLERQKHLDLERDRSKARNFFERVDVTRIEGGVARPQKITPSGSLARFLEFGVTSFNPTRLGGCLFLGSQRYQLEVDETGVTEAVFDLQNQSRGRAVFSVSVDGSTLAQRELRPRGEERLRLAIPAGRHAVALETSGSDSGLFLWGAPYLSRGDRTELTPVVIITLDTTRRDAVSPYSDRPELTPNLHAFAQHATAYRDAYAVAPWTLPSHVSIFTGLYPSHHGVGVADHARVDQWPTLAELFRRAGYRTAGFAGGSLASSDFGLAKGFSLFRDPRKNQEPGDVLTEAATAFVESASDQPIFLFINYFDPHAPYRAPSAYRRALRVDELGRAIEGVPFWGEFARNEPRAWWRIASGEAPESDAGNAYLRAVYRAEVAFMDGQIGRLFELLRSRDLYDRALIVVVADHGEYLGERGLYEHSYRLDPELTAIPLLIKWPHQAVGRVAGGLVSQVDLFPTIAAAAGLEVPPSDGIGFSADSMSPLLGRRRVYMEEHASLYHQLQGPFKLADHVFGVQEIDLREVFFRGAIECSRRREGRWVTGDCRFGWEDRLAELPVWMAATLDLPGPGGAEDLDEAEAERLRALGYLR